MSLLFLFILNASALTLRDSVEQTINTNPEIIAEHKNQDAFKKYVDEEEGDYFPTLNLESYYEESHQYNRPDDAKINNEHKNGWNTQLKLEQILYDGGLTPSEIEEYQHKYKGNSFRSNLAIEDILLTTTNSYLNMVQYKELMTLSSNMIQKHEKNLITAKEKETISGEKLEIYQVSSKLHLTGERLIEQEDLGLQAQSNFKRYTGISTLEDICRPSINDNIIPNSLEKTLKLAVQRNYSILEQIENIKVQREKLKQTDAKFLPTLLFQLQAEWDSDLELVENGRQDEYRARLFLSWNLYQGGKSKDASQREVLFLQEAKKTLNSVTEEVVSKVTNAYNSYDRYKKRVDMLKEYVTDNRNILNIYIDEFDSGTRTFIDILNAEAELYNSKTSLVGREFELYTSYYSLLSNLSILSDTILSRENFICKEMVEVNIFNEKDNSKKLKDIDMELEGLFEEENSDASTLEIEEEKQSAEKFEYLNTDSISLDTQLTKIEKKQKVNAQPEVLLKRQKKEKKYIEKFINAPSSYFTLSMATETSEEEAKYLLKRYKVKDKGYMFSYGKNRENIKILYGIYANYKEAKEALKGLDKKLVEINSPYVSYIRKYQKLYAKYN